MKRRKGSSNSDNYNIKVTGLIPLDCHQRYGAAGLENRGENVLQ